MQIREDCTTHIEDTHIEDTERRVTELEARWKQAVGRDERIKLELQKVTELARSVQVCTLLLVRTGKSLRFAIRAFDGCCGLF